MSASRADARQHLLHFQGPPKDRNFFLWALIPYIAALSGEALMDRTVSFEQAATLRPDGGHNLCYASVLNPEAVLPKYFDSMRHWCGPCWNKVEAALPCGRSIPNGRLAGWTTPTIWKPTGF